jgi:hypothetical protein
MRYAILMFIISVSVLLYVVNTSRNAPFPDGTFLGERYRISNEEPDATIKTKFFITDGEEVEQQLTLTDVSLSNHAVFKFHGTLSSCHEYICVYTRKGNPLVLADMKKSHYHSKYLELLSKSDELKSEVQLFLKNNKYIIVFERAEKRPYLYAVAQSD